MSAITVERQDITSVCALSGRLNSNRETSLEAAQYDDGLDDGGDDECDDDDAAAGSVLSDEEDADAEAKLLLLCSIKQNEAYVTGGKDVSVVARGSLARNVQFWEGIGACKYVVNVIRNGYALPFNSLPKPYVIRNHKSAQAHASFVNESVEDLLERGCVQQVDEGDVIVSSPLGVVNNGKKLRLILDLRYVNMHLKSQKFKLEDWKTITEVYGKGDFLVTFDLKSGYHHIEIAEAHRKYLGFKWQLNSVTKSFVFCVLPFGLSTAPYLFTKVTKPLLSHWRRQGIRCHLYMDDGAGGHSTYEGAVEVGKTMLHDLKAAGFVPHPEKCCWTPSQEVEMLGMQFNLKNDCIKVTEKRVVKLKHCLQIVKHSTVVSAREVARLAGYLLSMSLAVGPVCRLHTRAMYRFIESRTSWSACRPLTKEVADEVDFWISTFDKVHGQPIWKSIPVKAVLTWSDASDSGWGGFSLQQGLEVAHGEWPPEVLVRGMSSTWRELRGTALVLSSLAHRIAGSTCIHRTDNQAAAHIITNGSRKDHLQAEALSIHKICQQHNVKLVAEWVPREQNELADYYSKIVDRDDWQVNPQIFQQLDHAWGPHTLDCFASYVTKQLPRFLLTLVEPRLLCC